MKNLYVIVLVFSGSISFLRAETYVLDESRLLASFNTSEDVSAYAESVFYGAYSPYSALPEGGKSQTTGAIIAIAGPIVAYAAGVIVGTIVSVVTLGFGAFLWPVFFIPVVIPWHRFYLGTGGNNMKIGGLYCITLNWCGWLSFIDGIMMLIDDSKSKYIDNPKYVMWVGNI